MQTDEIQNKEIPTRPILFYVQDGFADWEYSYIIPVLQEKGCQVLFVSEQGQPVISKAGKKISPQVRVSEMTGRNVSGLILLGGDGWLDLNKNNEVLDLAEELLDNDKLVAAICNATVGLARRGLLNNRRHTSNDNQILKTQPNYKGERLYSWRLALTDQNLITSSGVGVLEFTQQLLSYFELFGASYQERWYSQYKNNLKTNRENWMQNS